MSGKPCRSCGTPVIWTVTERSGRYMPVVPDSAGVFVLLPGEPPIAAYKPEGEGPKYSSHFSRCPQAGQWRKKASA